MLHSASGVAWTPAELVHAIRSSSSRVRPAAASCWPAPANVPWTKRRPGAVQPPTRSAPDPRAGAEQHLGAGDELR